MIDQMKIAAHVILILALLSILMLAISFWLDMDVQEWERWIPVIERVPENNCLCLVFWMGEITTMNFVDGKFEHIAVTHWRKLTAPMEGRI